MPKQPKGHSSKREAFEAVSNATYAFVLDIAEQFGPFGLLIAGSLLTRVITEEHGLEAIKQYREDVVETLDNKIAAMADMIARIKTKVNKSKKAAKRK